MQKVINFINGLSTKSFILISVVVPSIFTIPFNFINMYFGRNTGGPNIYNRGVIGACIIGVILSPIIESFLIAFITKFLGLYMKNKVKLTIITGMLFACLHAYSYEYVLLVIGPSLVLVYSYVLYDNKNNKISSFLIMTIIHSLYNLMQLISTEFIYYYLTH